MKFSTTSTALILACSLAIQAAPTNVGTELSTREENAIVEGAIYNMQDYIKKRSTFSEADLTKRESQIVTDVLKAIKDTDLAPKILKYIVSDDTLKPIAIDTITKLIKNGTINLDTLLTSLNDSGLAVEVIQNLISDCSFYADIYKLALSYIGDLADKIAAKISGSNSKREFKMFPVEVASSTSLNARDDSSILTSLMESLKDSGLADQVVRELIVDPDFLSFGADLIKELFDDDAITVSELISDLADSGLVPSLIKAFLNLGTFNTIITNALAAAFGKCDGSSVTSAITSVTSATETGSATATATGICRKKKRSYNY